MTYKLNKPKRTGVYQPKEGSEKGPFSNNFIKSYLTLMGAHCFHMDSMTSVRASRPQN